MVWLGLDDETVATVIGLAVFGNEILRTLSRDERAYIAALIMDKLDAVPQTAPTA
jgi:hypothetical protein